MPELLPELAQSPGHMIWRAAAAVGATLGTHLPPGMDIHAYAVLLALSDGQPRSQQALADSVAVSRTTLAKVAAALAADGLVERVRNPADRRSYALTRTARGTQALRRWRPHAEALETAYGAGAGPAERDELRDLLATAARPLLSPETPPPLLESIGFLVTRLHARLHAGLSEALRDLHREPRHLGTMSVLLHAGPESQAQLAGELGVSGATVVDIADGLAGSGYVERVRSATDRRNSELHLTPDGERAYRAAGRRAGAVVDEVLAPLTDRQRRRLTALLVRFVTGG